MYQTIDVVEYVLVFLARWAGWDKDRFNIEYILPDNRKNFLDMHLSATYCYNKEECLSVAIIAIEKDKLFSFSQNLYATSSHFDIMQDETLLLSKCKDNNLPIRYDDFMSRQYSKYSLYYLRTKASDKKLFYNPHGESKHNIFTLKTFSTIDKATDYAKSNITNRFIKVCRVKCYDMIYRSK